MQEKDEFCRWWWDVVEEIRGWEGLLMLLIRVVGSILFCLWTVGVKILQSLLLLLSVLN